MSRPNGIIFLECPCGLNRGIPLTKFDDGTITQCPDKHVVVKCPDCSKTRKTSKFDRIYKETDSNPDEPIWYRLVIDEQQPLTDGKNPFDALQSRGQSEDTETHPDCDCGHTLTEGHKRYNPEGPGNWEYYECPECGNTLPSN